MEERDFWEGYEDEPPLFEDLFEYQGPNRHSVEVELNRLLARLARGSEVQIDWSKGRCVQRAREGWNPDIWFCPGDTKPSAVAADECFECPIRLDCLEFACVSGTRYGMYGGLPENLRAGKGEGVAKNITAYNYESLSQLGNVYDAPTRKYRYHRSRLKDWEPGQEYFEEAEDTDA